MLAFYHREGLPCKQMPGLTQEHNTKPNLAQDDTDDT